MGFPTLAALGVVDESGTPAADEDDAAKTAAALTNTKKQTVQTGDGNAMLFSPIGAGDGTGGPIQRSGDMTRVRVFPPPETGHSAPVDIYSLPGGSASVDRSKGLSGEAWVNSVRNNQNSPWHASLSGFVDPNTGHQFATQDAAEVTEPAPVPEGTPFATNPAEVGNDDPSGPIMPGSDRTLFGGPGGGNGTMADVAGRLQAAALKSQAEKIAADQALAESQQADPQGYGKQVFNTRLAISRDQAKAAADADASIQEAEAKEGAKSQGMVRLISWRDAQLGALAQDPRAKNPAWAQQAHNAVMEKYNTLKHTLELIAAGGWERPNPLDIFPKTTDTTTPTTGSTGVQQPRAAE